MNDNEEEAQQSITLPDPVEVLPTEMVQYMLSSLPPSSIAAASAASTRWRDLILSDSTLFREIDLSKLTSTWAMMPHFHRLSSLSHHRLSKVSVDLTSLWEEDEYGPYKYDDDEEDGQIESLKVTKEAFFELLELSKESLKEISFNIRRNRDLDARRFTYSDDFYASGNALPFLTGLLHKLSEYPQLRKISLKAPSFISLKSGTDVSGSKLFEIEDISWSDDKGRSYDQELMINHFDEFDSPRLDLMKHCRDFTGSGLVEFGGGGWVYQSESILEELWKSSSTLESIDLEGFNFEEDDHIRSNIWKHATHCEKLCSFSLSGQRPRSDMDYSEFYFDAKVVRDGFLFYRNSRRLIMNSLGNRMDWSVISDMVGNDLEEFRLTFDKMGNRTGHNDCGFLRCIVLRFQSTLRILSLYRVDFRMDVEPNTQDSLNFPELQSLTLVNVQDSMMEVFSTVRAPKLVTISISCKKFTSSASESLLTLLKSHDAQLTTIEYMMDFSSADLHTEVDFHFSDLEILNLGEHDETAAAFFSRFNYPKLKNLTPSESKHHFEGIAPNLSGAELGK